MWSKCVVRNSILPKELTNMNEELTIFTALKSRLKLGNHLLPCEYSRHSYILESHGHIRLLTVV